MAGAHQHDAHEFFIRCLESIHYDIVGQNDSSSCTCLSHRTFNGTQTSNVICKSCGHTSKTKEGFGDISLSVNTKSSKGYVTLADCLRRYEHPAAKANPVNFPNSNFSITKKIHGPREMQLHVPKLFKERRLNQTILIRASAPRP